jgi:hypothetical protein
VTEIVHEDGLDALTDARTEHRERYLVVEHERQGMMQIIQVDPASRPAG